MASNLSTYPDIVDFGDFSDWIELYNDENTSVNIGGYYLTDDFAQPMKWQIPPNTTIPAKGFYLIWADDFDDIPGQNYFREWWPHNVAYTTQWCHTNFKLNKDGDSVGLFDADGNIIDTLTFKQQETDISYGRQPDGGDNFYYYGEPTPLASNISSALNSISYSGEVLFSINGGFYENSVQVSLSSSSASGVIHYTTDSSKPGSSSTEYTSSISINKNTILKARLFEEGKIPGKINTQSYFIAETRHLPAVSISADNHYLMNRQTGIYRNTIKEREIPVHLEYYPLSGDQTFALDAGMRIGGENIYRFAQKPLNIYARGSYGSSKINYKIFGDLPYLEYKRLYLRNSGDDWPNTMFKDGLLVSILKGQITNSMQDYKPSVLYLNGNYWGIYNLREKLDEQYFLLHYNTDPNDLDHLESNNIVISGDSTDFVQLLNFANANDLSVAANYDYVKSKIDIHNLMDFVIVQDYLANSSWGHNREVWRDKRTEKLWRWVLVDMDRGFDPAKIARDQLSDIYANFGLFRRLCDNQDFVNEFVQRYSQHIDQIFNSDRVLSIIDSLKSQIEDEMPRHINKWGTYIDSLSIDEWGQTAGVSSLTYWNNQIGGMTDFASQRSSYAIQYLSNIFSLSGRSQLSCLSNPDNQGKIAINGIISEMGKSFHFFNNIPLNITVYPPPGYQLKQWKEIISIDTTVIENIISTEPSIEYAINGNTQLVAEYEEKSSGMVPEVINSSMTLTTDGSPYFITNDVHIESGGTLIVNPGVEIQFAKEKSIYVNGKLLVEGNINAPVSLMSYYPSDKWGAICFDSTSQSSELNYVNISHATHGSDPVNFFAAVSALKSTVTLNHVNFNNCTLPVSSQWSNMTIDGCHFENIYEVGDYINCNGGNIAIMNSVFEGNEIADMDAIDLGLMTGSTLIQNNIIRDFSGDNTDGIDIGDASTNVIIKNNIILNCRDKGISVGQGSNVQVIRNAIAGCNMGMGIKDSLSFASIINNTFYNNDVGVACFEKNLNAGGGKANIINSIFSKNNASYTIDELSEISISYSLSDRDSLPGSENIYNDARMINPGDANFYLQVNSIAIDAGDPSFKDDDGSRVDIGAYACRGEKASDIVINEINYNSSIDFDSEDWIELYNKKNISIDLTGWVFMDETHKPSFVIKPGTILQSGAYLVLCRDVQMFVNKYPDIHNYDGNLQSGLSGKGEALFLYSNTGYLMDSLTYNDKDPWPVAADGNGSSLELVDPEADNAVAINWKASKGHGTPGTINSVSTSRVDNPVETLPGKFDLKPNYPNPFNPGTLIPFDIPVNTYIDIKIFDTAGREIKLIENGMFKAGRYKIFWDGTNMFGKKVTSGLYFICMHAGNFFKVQKALLLK